MWKQHGISEKIGLWVESKSWPYWELKIDHPLFDELHDEVMDIMIGWGPDRHTDGSNLIVAWILEHYDIKKKES